MSVFYSHLYPRVHAIPKVVSGPVIARSGSDVAIHLKVEQWIATPSSRARDDAGGLERIGSLLEYYV